MVNSVKAVVMEYKINKREQKVGVVLDYDLDVLNKLGDEGFELKSLNSYGDKVYDIKFNCFQKNECYPYMKEMILGKQGPNQQRFDIKSGHNYEEIIRDLNIAISDINKEVEARIE